MVVQVRATKGRAMADENVEVKLLADYLDGRPVYESVPATRVGENRYRLRCSPGMAPGVASGDEIELSPAERTGYRVVRRSGNISVQVFLYRCNDDDRRGITKLVEHVGGWLDGGHDSPSGHLLVFTIPLSVGFEAIEAAMERVKAEFGVEKWMYGNVYDTRDGVTPLNWWLCRGSGEYGGAGGRKEDER